MRFEFGTIQLDVDVERTRQYFANAPLLTDDCGCAGCRNYVRAAEHLPQEVLDFFAALGLDIRKTPEVYVLYVPEEGKLCYEGWYHLCGRILSGEATWCEDLSGPRPPEDAWFQVADGFRVAFLKECQLLPDDFPEPALQMEISATNIPWVLEEENCYADWPIQGPQKP